MPAFGNLNGQVKTTLRFYRNLDEQWHRGLQCHLTEQSQCDVEHGILVPEDALVPFQIWMPNTQGFPTSFRLFDIDGNEVANPGTTTLTVVNLLDMKYIVYEGGSLGTIPSNARYAVIETSQLTFYSELFKPICDPECHMRLWWNNCGNVGNTYYQEGFINKYLMAANSYIARPSPQLTIEEEENERKDVIEVFRRGDVEYRIQLGYLAWPTLDALCEAPLCDNITLVLEEIPGGRLITVPIHSVRVEYEYDDIGMDCFALTTVVFRVDEAAISTQCCSSFDLACPTSCVEAEGVRPDNDDDLVEGQVYLLDNGSYATFYGLDSEEPIDDEGFGSATRCLSRYANTANNGYMYYSQGQWRVVAEITSATAVSCEGDPHIITVIASIMLGFNGQLFYRTDVSGWIEVGDEYAAAEWAAGVSIEIPTTAAFIMIRAVREDCGTLGTSEDVVHPCYCGEPFIGTVGTEYSFCPDFWDVMFEEILSTDNFQVLGVRIRINDGEWVEYLDGEGAYIFSFNDGEVPEMEVIGSVCNFTINLVGCP